MNAHKANCLIVVILLGLVATVYIGPSRISSASVPRSRPADAIIVNNADSILTLVVTGSSGLDNSASDIAPRIVVQYANSIRSYGLMASQSLSDSLADVGPRIVVQYANSNKDYRLHYPVGLIPDNTPPQITSTITYYGSGTTETINWTTNEFARSVLYLGTQSGVYPRIITDTLYYTSHAFNVTGLTSCTRYYFKIRSTDQSGNTVLSSEYGFVTKCYVYLPIALKNH